VLFIPSLANLILLGASVSVLDGLCSLFEAEALGSSKKWTPPYPSAVWVLVPVYSVKGAKMPAGSLAVKGWAMQGGLMERISLAGL